MIFNYFNTTVSAKVTSSLLGQTCHHSYAHTQFTPPSLLLTTIQTLTFSLDHWKIIKNVFSWSAFLPSHTFPSKKKKDQKRKQLSGIKRT